MTGHGIGRQMHEDPDVPNYGRRGVGPLLRPGMCICIEPMINMGSKNVTIDRNGWTVRTRDHACSAHYEHCVAIFEDHTEILSTFDYVQAAISKGVEAAKKNLIKVPVLNGTIPHEQAAKFGGSQVLLIPASEGTGLKAGGAMRPVLESIGIKDVLAKSKGSSNPHNLVKATIAALAELRDAKQVAENRGVSLEVVFKG